MNKNLNIKVKIKNDANKEINLKDIYLSKFNPRFNLFDDKENLFDSIKKEIDKNYNEKETFENLISLEGNFSELLDLLESINNYGFSDEEIYILKLDNLENKYVVAEGNRRIMALKLISNIFEIDDRLKNILINTNSKTYSDEIQNYINEIDIDDNIENDNCSKKDNEKEQKEKNLKRCFEIIKKINDEWSQNDKEIVVNANLITEKKELYNIIYEKHINGKRVGLRPWSRSKYFADLLKKFPNGLNISENDFLNDEFLSSIKRNKKVLSADYKEAQFVYWIIFYGKGYKINESLKSNLNNPDILDEMIKLEKPSVLEKCHSFNKIVDLICKKILNISKDKFSDDYFEIKIDKDYKLEFIDKKISAEKLFGYIYDLYKQKKLTTRPFKEEYEKSIIDDLTSIINNITSADETSIENYIQSVDLYCVSLKKLRESEKYYSRRNDENNNSLIFLKETIRIRENNENFKNEIVSKLNDDITTDEINPKYVFKELADQFVSINEKFLHARAATIRSMIEQFKIWLFYIILENKKNDPDEDVNTLKEKQDTIVDYLYKNKTLCIIKYENNKMEFSKYFNKFNLEEVLNNNINIDDKKEKDNYIVSISELFNLEKNQNDDFKYFLNQLIHCYWRRHYYLYEKNVLEKDNLILKKYSKYFENVIKLIKVFNFNSFNQFNDEIIKHFKKEIDKKINNN